jgi:antitoxin (DNA-binding transcriptional repressor) of toxin-antitoxin stability system
MITISLDEIGRDLLGYLQRVQAGETFVILQADKPVAEIKQVRLSAKQFRPFGLCGGEFRTAEDFDAPLPEQIIAQFDRK